MELMATLVPRARQAPPALPVPKVQQDELLPELTIGVLLEPFWAGATLAPCLLKVNPSDGGVVFGSSISTAGTPPFTAVMLQPGIYQIHLSSGPGNTPFIPPIGTPPGFAFYLQASLGGTVVGGLVWPVVASTSTSSDIVPGDRLFSVAQPNSILQINTADQNGVISGDCELIITRLQ